MQYLEGKYRHIFSKCNDDFQQNTGLNFPNNAPGLYLSPIKNELIVMMNTYNVINEEIRIPDVPMNKWVNIIIICKGKNLDVYVNGLIARSIKLVGVPKQNYGDVYVAANGGFGGYISNLFYYAYAVNVSQIQKIIQSGPNTKLLNSPLTSTDSSYLAQRWYFY